MPPTTPELHEAIEHAYCVFSRYSLSGSVTVCRCPVCVSDENARALSTTPLRDIPSALLAQYTHSAHSWDESIADEFRYFLPRYLDLIATSDAPSTIGIETCLERLHDADYRRIWPTRESDAIDAFFVAFFRARLTAPFCVNPHGLPTSENDNAEDILCMVAHAGGDVTELLTVWEAECSRAATLRIANMIGSTDWRKKRLKNSFWVGLSRPHCEAAMAQVMSWILRSQTRTRLELACLDEPDGDAAALLSHAEGIVGGMI